jgi:hypothetical protein
MSNLKKDRLVKDMIVEVLANNTNGYMTVADIAEIAFAGSYSAYTYKHLNDLVKRSIYSAIAKLHKQGLVVIGKKNEKIKSNPIDRWKVAGSEDKSDVEKVLNEKTNRTQGYMKAANVFIENATENKILDEVEQFKLK